MLDPRTVYTMRRKGEKQIAELAIQMHVDRGLLCYYNFNRGHALRGEITKEYRGGGVEFDFRHGEAENVILQFRPLTYDEFNAEIRPNLSEWESRLLNDLDDVYTYYRRIAGIS